MEDNQLVQMIEYHKETLARIVNVSVAENGSTLCFGLQSLWRNVVIVMGYLLAIVLLLFAIAGFSTSWYLSTVCIVFTLACHLHGQDANSADYCRFQVEECHYRRTVAEKADVPLDGLSRQ